MLWSSTQNGHDGPLPFAAGGFSLGWERRLLKGNFLYGFQPQISFIGHSKGGVLGLLPHAFVGVRGQSLSWTIGIVQQTYFIAQRGFSSRTGEDCAQCFDSGFSYGWGAQSRLVWMRKETAGIFAQSTFGGDGLRTMNLINVGYIRDY
jgi:hypothetical protein